MTNIPSESESTNRANFIQEIRKSLIYSVAANTEASFQSTHETMLAIQSYLEKRQPEIARLEKYVDKLNLEYPVDFADILTKCLEMIDESKSRNPDLAAKLTGYFDDAVAKAEALLATKLDPTALLRAFDDIEDALLRDMQSAQNLPLKVTTKTLARKKQSARKFIQLTSEQKQHIRICLVNSINSWHGDVELSGEGKYLILSPFRIDKNKGSFIIYRDGGAYDFATGERYDVIDIWAKLNGMRMGDALYALAQRYGFAPVQKLAVEKKPTPNSPSDAFSLPSDLFFHHKEHGAPSVVYRYCNAEGRVIGFVARYETPHLPRKKHFCPFSLARNAKGQLAWSRSIAGWNGIAPIYGLEILAVHPTLPVGIVEGEKPVAAARALFPNHIILTWQGGAGNVARVDWTLLAGRVVEFVWPDADQKLDKKTGALLPLHQQPGMKAALHIVSALNQVGCNPQIIMPPEGVFDGWDLADALEEGWSPEKAQAHAASHARSLASLIDLNEQKAEADANAGTPSDQDWRANDIVADLRIKFAREIEQGTYLATFPFAAEYRNYIPSTSGSTRAAPSILVSLSDKGQVTIARPETFVDGFVLWYDEVGRLAYNEANLSDDQLRTLAIRLAQRLPSLGGEPLIFKKTDDPGYAWHLLDLDVSADQEYFKSLPDLRDDAEEFAMQYLEKNCPYWHEQLSRMGNRLAFLCYLGSILDLSAKPQQYLWLYGEGQDGKSTILKVLKKVLGGAALMTDWPHYPNNFYTARFEGKRVLLVDEEPEGTCVRTDLWRRTTGSDTITIEPKGKQAYEISNNMLIVVGSNYRPSTRTRKADMRRLIICDVKSFQGIPYARVDEHLLEEFSNFISLCQALWVKFKGISNLAPVDEAATKNNVEEVHAKVSEFIFANFELMNIGRVAKALNCPEFPNNGIPHTLNRELEKACKHGNVEYEAVRQYMIEILRLIPGQVSYSKMDKPRLLYGIVANKGLREKLGLETRSFERWPTFSPDTADVQVK